MRNTLLIKIAFGILCVWQTKLLYSQAENLVNNSSFEIFEKCPTSYVPSDKSHRFIPDWTYPTYATPDYFNRCAPKSDLGVSVPRNFAGVSEPHSGDAYAGAILSGTDDGYREYIQGELSEALQAGKKYCVTYYYKLASFSKFSVDQLSLYFTDLKIENSLNTNIGVAPQINNQRGLFLDNTEEWESKCVVYTAQGGERYFVMGNFMNYENTNYVATAKDMKNLRDKAYAYYYIDDVSIKAMDDCTDCECVQHDFEAHIIDSSYINGAVEVKQQKKGGHIKVGMAGGTPPYTVRWNDGTTGAELWGLAPGKYEFTAFDINNCISKGSIVFSKPPTEEDNFSEGLKNIKEGESIILKNIFFEYDKTTLLPKSFPELDKVLDFMETNNISLIEISGHTDSDGSDDYNRNLSEGRAKSVVEYLKSKGIAETRLKAVGYGEAKPIDTNFSDEGKAQNRRVEFTLLKK